VQVVDDLIYLACSGLTILRAHPDLFITTATITPAGGRLVNFDKSIDLSFPAGAVIGDTSITYKGLFEPTQQPYAGRGALRSFTLEAPAVTQTTQLYTMVISYTESALKSLGITDESSLNLSRWNGAAWVDLLPCAGCALDTQNNRLTVQLNRFDEFVLSGKRPAVFLPLIRR
jgi:hypothetical protein